MPIKEIARKEILKNIDACLSRAYIDSQLAEEILVAVKEYLQAEEKEENGD